MPKALFIALSALGTFAVWGRNILDGSFAQLSAALELHGSSEYILPGAKEALASFTGIAPLDRQLGIFILFFWGAVDGSHPAASAVGIYFLGQYLSVLTAMYIDGLRKGNGSGVGK